SASLEKLVIVIVLDGDAFSRCTDIATYPKRTIMLVRTPGIGLRVLGLLSEEHFMCEGRLNSRFLFRQAADEFHLHLRHFFPLKVDLGDRRHDAYDSHRLIVGRIGDDLL